MNNRIKRIFRVALMAVGLMAVGPVHAALVAYEKVGFIEGKGYYSDAFQIDTGGSYKATLTDFDFPSLFGQLTIDVITATQSKGKLAAPGSFVFDAQPGTYYANLLGVADGPINLGLFGVQIESMDFSPVAPIPVPAAIILLASGLCVLWQTAWCRRGEVGCDGLVTKESYSSAMV